jgi:hypothetical protein
MVLARAPKVLPPVKRPANRGLSERARPRTAPELLDEDCVATGSRLTCGKAIYDALNSKTSRGLHPVRMVRGSWLRQRAQQIRDARKQWGPTSPQVMKLALPCRQQMPEEGFISAEELKFHEPGGFVGRNWRIAVLACSHCWRQRGHPDPYGETVLMLSDAIENRIEKRVRPLDHWAQQKHMWDEIWSFEHFPTEFGLFFDVAEHADRSSELAESPSAALMVAPPL